MSVCRIDRTPDKHDLLVTDETGVELSAATYAHDEKGVASLCRVLVRMEVAPVAVERPDGLPVERLLDAGLRVLALHPNEVAAAQDRFRVSGGKLDRLRWMPAFQWIRLARSSWLQGAEPPGGPPASREARTCWVRCGSMSSSGKWAGCGCGGSRDASRFHRRLRRGYSRSGDGHPGRPRIGSSCWAGRGGSLDKEDQISKRQPPRRRRRTVRLAGR
jgi:hypothetical protein